MSLLDENLNYKILNLIKENYYKNSYLYYLDVKKNTSFIVFGILA